jgi:signal transduction histidine kinase/CheY-like chemotaxis protein
MSSGDFFLACSAVVAAAAAGALLAWTAASRDRERREPPAPGADVPEVHPAEAALRASEERLRLATMAAGIGTWDWDLVSGEVRWFDGAEPGQGLSAGGSVSGFEGVLGRIHPEDQSRVATTLHEALSSAGEHVLQFRVVRRDGEIRWGEARGMVLHDDAGRPIRTIGVAVDITEHKRREAERQELLAREQEARATAEGANRTKDVFLAMLGHELRNPIAAVRNAVTAARLDAGRRERALEIAHRQTDQLARLVDDLLDVARITQGRIALQHEPVALAGLLDGAVEASRLLIEERGHTLTLSLPPSPVTLAGDPTRLQQIFANLLANAAKFTNPGGRIDVEGRREGKWIVVAVRDTGVGIGAEMLPRIFDLFTQGSRTLDRGHAGLGVGLTVVKRLVELHGGHVEGRSEGPGRGAEFVVRLPLARGAHPDGEPVVGAPPATATRLRVLLVEDDPDAAETLAMIVEHLGHEVVRAPDAPAALAAVTARRPDAALVDIGLPGMDGYELARRLCALGSGRPPLLVALTGFGREQDRQQALAAGFDHHAVKPIDLDGITGLLARVPPAGDADRANRRGPRSAPATPRARSDIA